MSSSKPAKQPRSKMTEHDEAQLGSKIISIIQIESHRPSAIVNALRREYDQNTVLKILLKLEKEGKVEREGKKTWIAKGKEKEKGKEKGKEKEKGKAKEKEKEKEKESEKSKDKEKPNE